MVHRILWLWKKAITLKPLHRHCKRRFLVSTHVLQFCFAFWCVQPTEIITLLLNWVSVSGCSIVTSITAGRKTFTGEKCECSSSEKNGGASEKLTASNPIEQFFVALLYWKLWCRSFIQILHILLYLLARYCDFLLKKHAIVSCHNKKCISEQDFKKPWCCKWI